MTERTPDVARPPADAASWRNLDPQAKRAALARLVQQQRAESRTGVSKIVPQPDQWHEPFPLTDVQHAYWLGQTELFGLGNVATHAYSEVDVEDLDLERFVGVWNRLIRYHPMLRAVILPDGTQRILPDVPEYRPRVVDLRGLSADDAQQALDQLRAELSHQVLPADRWPLFEVAAAIRDSGLVRMHVSFSLLTIDAWSIKLLLAQWGLLYQFPGLELPALEISFRDVVLHQETRKRTASYERAKQYWTERLEEFPPAPDLPLACDPGSVQRPRFARRSTSLDAMRWTRIKEQAAKLGCSPSSVLLAAFGDVLRTWSRSSRFTVNVTLFNRPPVHPQIGELVGDFTSLTLETCDGRRSDAFVELMRRQQEQLGRDLDHVDYTGIEVLRELLRKYARPPATIMPVVFTNIVGKSSLADDVPLGEVVYGISQTPQVWLDHQIFERNGALIYNWDFVEALFPPGLIDDMFQAYTRFLRRLSEDDAAWQERDRRHLPDAQWQQRRLANATKRPLRDVRLESLFYEQVERQPNAVAVATPERRLTYAELAERVRRVAAWLQSSQVKPNTLVAVVMDKGWEQAAAALGILSAGAAYLPIEPSLPGERIRDVLTNGEVSLALTQPQWRAADFWPEGIVAIAVDDELPPTSTFVPTSVERSTDDLAYVIYTSGSTGQPKGVMITHRAAVNTILDVNERFGISDRDRVLGLSALSFDLSVYDIFGLLAAGGAVVLPEPDALRNPDRWVELMEREQVTVWNTVPSLMEMLVEAAKERPLDAVPLRRVFLSGDWIAVSLPARVRALFPRADVISLGGATEAAIWSIYHPIEALPDDAPSVPYGRPLSNQTWHVLNEDGLPCPVWVPGELYIGGTGLALGYWKDAERTAARFVRHPQTGERLYRTGDWGRYLPNGDIEFLGREDTQVKILGHRIELGEIEAALLEHDGVRGGVVCAVGDPRGKRRLAAFVVPKEPSRSETLPAELSALLRRKLPHYMVPTDLHALAEFPLTSNGKVDRPALARLAEQLKERSVSDGIPAPALDDVAREVLTLIADEMGLPHLAASDNLMHVGASSIDMIRLVNRFEETFGFRPNLPDFFRNPTVNGLADLLRAHRAAPQAKAMTAASSGTPVLVDPAERAAFKQEQKGLRRFAPDTPSTSLPELSLDAERPREFAMRRSRRQFLSRPIPLADLSALLGELRQLRIDDQPKYRYGSAGGLYPVQTYVHLKTGAVAGMECGLSYYDPVRHALVPVAPGVELDREIHQPYLNQPIFDQCSLSLFLIGVPAAIEPLYGELSRHFITLEAGAMTQVLEEAAPRVQIGLCQIGWIDFPRIRPLFGLDDSHWLVHSLVGGPIPLETATPKLHRAGSAVEYQEGEL